MLQRFDSGEARGCSCQRGDVAVAACGAGRGACQRGYWGLKEPGVTDGGGPGLGEGPLHAVHSVSYFDASGDTECRFNELSQRNLGPHIPTNK